MQDVEAAGRNTLSSIVVAVLFGVSAMGSVNIDPAIATSAPGSYAFDSLAGAELTPSQVSSVSSSSFNLAKTITTMDMSLPSAYDKISSAKSSSTAELTLETDSITQTSRKKASTSTKSNDSSGSSSSGSMFSLPSMGGNNDNNLTDEEKAVIAAEKKAEREAIAIARAEEREAISAEKAAEREAIASAKVAEKEALAIQKAEENERFAEERAVERAEKKASAKAAKMDQEEKSEAKASAQKFNKADFVDFAMPSYDAGAKKDNVFAL
jgi:hypothetical protein